MVDETKVSEQQSAKDTALVAWVLRHVEDWETYRDTNYKKKWNEYYRLWRGIWSSEDKLRDSERSRLISPALQQAIESTVAELEEATFGKGVWFDLDDDIADQEKDSFMAIREQLHEDLEMNGVPAAISEIFLNGCIYGTGIGKIIISEEEDKTIQASQQINEFAPERPEVQQSTIFKVRLESVSPREFVIDYNARTIDEALGCAHIMFKPEHLVRKRQDEGIYREGFVGSTSDIPDVASMGESRGSQNVDHVKLVEYHGLVPKNLIDLNDKDVDDEGFTQLNVGPGNTLDLGDDHDLVEAIVTIANDAFLLRASENPLLMKDRGFIAYQHDTVPNRFWGRGVAEKGYNPQKALDAELRARLDGLALTVHPMMAGDITRLPRGSSLKVQPGKYIYTTGDPRTVLMPFNFGAIDQNTFSNAADLERMIQMGTGAMDSASPVGNTPRNQTASGMSMMLSGSIKRSKRTLQNIDRNFLSEFIKKTLWRYMQFDPDRYQPNDYKFVVTATMGIMAREFEQSQLTALLNTVPPESPAYWILLRSVYENSSISNRDEMIGVIKKFQEQSENPQPPQPDPIEQAKIEQTAQEFKINSQIEKMRIDQRIRELDIREREALSKEQHDEIKLSIQQADVASKNIKAQADALLSIAKAEGEEIGQQINSYIEVVRGLQDDVANAKTSLESTITSDRGANSSSMDSFKKQVGGDQKAIASFIANVADKTMSALEEQQSRFDSQMNDMNEKMDTLLAGGGSSEGQPDEVDGLLAGVNIQRDSDGLIETVNGKSVIRNDQGLIEGLE